VKIVAVDDDLVSRMVLRGAVQAIGHDCLVAEDGDQAWRLIRACHPDVVITDWVMPGTDGLQLCRLIRGQQAEAYTYVILATSLGERDHVLKGMEAGADDYLTKPLDPYDLEARLVAAKRVTSLHAELARYRTELARLACTDALTQLRNRLSLSDDLTKLHARSRRYGRGYSLAMCDVDFFKRYNDTHGHQSGDEALRSVAAVLTAQTRQGDSIYRYGGEEFLLVLPEQSASSATEAAERIRHAVESLGITHPAGTSAGVITISVGVATYNCAGNTTSEDLLEEADNALYYAKSNGRNRVAHAAGHAIRAPQAQPPTP
jgi:diguanylate cyclase (GGDEF)-like protein